MSATSRSSSEPSARGPGARTRRPRAWRATLLGVLAVAATLIAAPAASAQAWPCNALGYLFQTQPGATGSQIVQVDLATGEQTTIGDTSSVVNGAGYNVVDGYFYGLTSTTDPITGVITQEIGRIHADGTVDHLAPPPGVTLGVVGDVDGNGHYWNQGGGNWYEIDLTTPTPTLLRSGPVTPPAPIVNPGADWAFIDGALYSIGRDATEATYLVRFDPPSGTFTNVGRVGVTGGVGATFADASGYLYASVNANNNVYRIDPTTRQTILAAPGTGSSPGNDGARCAQAVVPTITVTKTVAGRVRPADQFTVSLQRPDGSLADSATTSGAAPTASTVNFPASQGKTYAISEAMASGAPTPLGEYVSSIECKDTAGNPVPVGGGGPSWTLLVADATFYTCNITNTAQSDLELAKTASPTPVVPGTDETYVFRVTNHGPSTATNVSVTDPLPGGLTFESGDPGCAAAGKTVTCTAAEIAPGASATFTIKTKVATSVTGCDGPNGIGNTASVSSTTSDPNPANNSAAVCPPIEPKVGLSMTKTPSASQVPTGGQVMYTLVVENKGPSDARDVKVSDALAAGLSLVAAKPSQGSCSTDGGRVACSLGSLRADGSAHVLVTATITATSGCVTNGSLVTSGDKSASATALVCVQPPPQASFDLSVTKKANHRTVYIGQRTTYTIEVTNKGPDAAPNTEVTDTFNVPASVSSVKPTQGTCTESLPIICRLGTVPAGGKVTITVVIKPKESSNRARNAASGTGTGKDNDPSNNMARTTTKVKKVKLHVTKVADGTTMDPGDRMTYTIRVSNPTSGVAQNVKTCDRLPSGLRYVSSKAKAKRSGGQYCWTVKTLGAHKAKRYRITVRALPGANGDKVNRATASSPDATTARAKRAVAVRGVATPVTG
jgi:uncharacterized repeat protein (TIGR01451 family)